MISPGASVTEGQAVMELETDKAVIEVPSSVSGTVKEVRVKEGDKLKVGQVIFTVENGTGAKAKAVETKTAEPKPSEEKSSKAKVSQVPAKAETVSTPAVAVSREAQSQVETRATPPPPVVPAPRPVTSAPIVSGATEFKLPEL